MIFKMIVAENISQLMIDFNSQIKQPKKKIQNQTNKGIFLPRHHQEAGGKIENP